MLTALIGVVKPPAIREASDVAASAHAWESKINDLKNRYDEEVGDKMKLAIMIGMLPKDFKDMVIQRGCDPNTSGSKLGYAHYRDYVFSVASQRLDLLRPSPTGGGINGMDWVADNEDADWQIGDSFVYRVSSLTRFRIACRRPTGQGAARLSRGDDRQRAV